MKNVYITCITFEDILAMKWVCRVSEEYAMTGGINGKFSSPDSQGADNKGYSWTLHTCNTHTSLNVNNIHVLSA